VEAKLDLMVISTDKRHVERMTGVANDFGYTIEQRDSVDILLEEEKAPSPAVIVP
jgi:hypothetical protein